MLQAVSRWSGEKSTMTMETMQSGILTPGRFVKHGGVPHEQPPLQPCLSSILT
jgi:hypothetical protein